MRRTLVRLEGATIYRPGIVVLLGAISAVTGSAGQARPPLRLVQSIPLDHVEGRIDHMVADPGGRWLFVAALGNNTVEVIDLRAGRRIRSLGGFRRPQGVCFVPERNRLFVASGDGDCVMLDGSSLRIIRREHLSEDADNIRYDATSKRVYVGCGGAIGVLDVQSGQSLDPIPLAGHPESFQLESVGPRVYVNLPDAARIAVVDRVAARVVAVWSIGGYAGNFPMALDEAGHRLFVACRRPAAVLVHDTRSGRRTAAIPISGDADGLFYDGPHGRLYVACGAGFLDVLERAPEGMVKMASIPTAPGARTALHDPGPGRLYLAVPHRGSQPAEIRVFEVVP